MKILFIQTGGTIDKDYPRNIKGYAFEIRKPAVKHILKKVKPVFDFEILSLIKKDSLEITKKDRDKLLSVCKNSKTDKIIITHGTDTMIETAKYLSVIKNKTIIITGAMKPERFKDSDAEFNIGTAVGAINNLKNGIYIAFKGEIFRQNEIGRNNSTGKFYKKL